MFILALSLISPDALAYFDPGSGSFFIQALIAIVGGIVLFFKDIRLKVASLLWKKDKQERDGKESKK